MDLATLIGLLIGVAVVGFAMLADTDATIFLNIPGMMIVMGGTFAATLIRFPIADCFQSFLLAIKTAFWGEPERPDAIIRQANKLTEIVRKKNLMALEEELVEDPFFQKGIQLAVDGRKPEFIRNVLGKEMNLSIERHQMGEKVFRAMGESAPAFGMVGTLVGLVQMLANMQDPASIGPAMAVALLTTLYGALFANLVAMPIADKLHNRCDQERINKSLILESVLGIQQGVNPRVLDELLEAYLPLPKRKVIHGETGAKLANQETGG